MKINAKLHCGIKALMEIAQNSGETGILQKDISVRQNMSVKFLDHIMSSLKAAGLIYRLPGRNGGYKLTSDPSEITIYQVYRAFEAEMNINTCLLDESLCPRTPSCGARCFFDRFNREIKNYMLTYSIKDLIDLESDNAPKIKENENFINPGSISL